MIKKLEKELKKLNAKRLKLSKFLSKQNKKTLSANQLELMKELNKRNFLLRTELHVANLKIFLDPLLTEKPFALQYRPKHQL